MEQQSAGHALRRLLLTLLALPPLQRVRQERVQRAKPGLQTQLGTKLSQHRPHDQRVRHERGGERIERLRRRQVPERGGHLPLQLGREVEGQAIGGHWRLGLARTAAAAALLALLLRPHLPQRLAALLLQHRLHLEILHQRLLPASTAPQLIQAHVVRRLLLKQRCLIRLELRSRLLALLALRLARLFRLFRLDQPQHLEPPRARLVAERGEELGPRVGVLWLVR
mmetsp:Transcript_28955/g.94314  ORF Transcript_28955/g.94314 Transcript_28955/m.94314 type:complete len:225 (-) Transcript_28955:842-1516(-)